MRSTITCSGVASRSTTFVDTWIRPPPSASPSAWTPGSPPDDSRTAAATSRATSSVPRSSRLNATSGCAHAEQHRAGRGSSRRGPERRRELAGVDPPLQLVRPAAPEERGPAPAADLAVEKDREPELLPHPSRRPRARRRLPARGRRPRAGTTGHDVRRADARVDAVVAPQVDPLGAPRRSPRRARPRARRRRRRA